MQNCLRRRAGAERYRDGSQRHRVGGIKRERPDAFRVVRSKSRRVPKQSAGVDPGNDALERVRGIDERQRCLNPGILNQHIKLLGKDGLGFFRIRQQTDGVVLFFRFERLAGQGDFRRQDGRPEPVSFKKELLHILRRHENIEVFRKPAVPFQTVVPALL